LKYKYKITTFIVSLTICLIVIYLHLLSHDKTQKIYVDQTEKTIINLRKDFIKDTVNNIFLEIDSLRETKNNNYKKNTEARLRRFNDELESNDQEFIEFFKDRFTEDLNAKMWTAFLWDNDTGEIYYASNDIYTETIENTVKELKASLSTYAEIKKGNIEGIFGVSMLYIDEMVKSEIADVIRNRKFSSESYMWVNEIINYEGGENYAIRKVHPNLKDTEGAYLSTETEDIEGNLPYLEELEGIKKDGELFFTYYFKKLNSSYISEKITYAKLYQDYDWVIAMGADLDDIDAYTEETSDEINSLSSESIIRLLRYIFIVLLIGFIILYLIERRQLSTSARLFEKEINIDRLTKASSRRYGEINLTKFFKQYQVTGEKPAIMMIDIDGFKGINDKYGHKTGDIVLTEVVKIINYMIRSSDQLVRWGGDEFVGIFPGLKEENFMGFAKKILEGISTLEIPVRNEKISVTLSIGVSCFKQRDTDYNDVLKRADEAMYKSKEQGKNRVNILL